MNQLGHEEQLVLRCLQARIPPGGEQLIQHLLTAGLNWESVGATAIRWGVAPLFYYNLHSLAPHLPSAAFQDLALAYLNASAQNSRLFSDLHTALLAFQKAGIEVVALKGAALSETVYPNRSARPMSDIDLLVRQHDLSGARDVLLDMGYVSSNPLSIEAQARISHHIQPLVSPHGTIVEIHWTLVRSDHPFKPNLDGLWEKARPAEVVGVPVRVLSAEDTLIYLSLQAAQDRFIHALKYVCDIAQVVARYQHEINWQVVSERARSWGGRHSVYLALYLARDLLGAEVPDETLAKLRPASFDARLAVWARDRLLRRAEEAQPLGPKFMRAWNAPTWGARCRNLAAMLFPPRDVVADLYHVPTDSRRVYWFYLVRLRNELRRTYRTLGRLLVHDRATAAAAEQDKALAEWLESD